MRFHVVHSISVGSKKRHVVQFTLPDIPDGITAQEITELLSASSHAPALTEYGAFMANRKVVPDNRLPVNAEMNLAIEVAWKDIESQRTVQVNMRVPSGSRAAWTRAAERAGMTLPGWAREVLDRAAAGS
jgi:hypothetical protein